MRKVFLVGFLVLVGCEDTTTQDTSINELPSVKVVSPWVDEQNVVYTFYSDPSLKTLVRKSKGGAFINITLPPGTYYAEVFVDTNANMEHDPGEPKAKDLSGYTVLEECIFSVCTWEIPPT